MSEILVLGAGMVGRAMAIDLAKKHEVTLTDLHNKPLTVAKEKCRKLNTIRLDASDRKSLQSAVRPFDLIVCAVPGSLGFQTVRHIIECGKNAVDISFFPENSLDLDKPAKENGVTVFVDSGVAPGMDNLILGHYDQILKLTDFECLVGGLPMIKKWPFCYKAPFSPSDVIEEYTRPARYVENSTIVVREPLTDCEMHEFDRVGTLESFNSDGLRTILFTMPHIRNMKEKTLRYPGHVEYVRVLKESGFFNKEKITVNGVAVSPLEVTSQILFDEWRLGDTEKEMTVMRITLKGENSGGRIEKVVYNLYDEYCDETQTSSMARTTGYTATAIANLFLEGLFSMKGVFPAELLGKNETCFNYIMDYLRDRGIHYEKTSTTEQ